MIKHKILGVSVLILISCLLFILPLATIRAATISGTVKSKKQLSVPFGGKVISLQVPTVTCHPMDGGTVPIVLSKNLAGVFQAGYSAIDKNQKGFQKAGNIVGGVYKAIPLYTVGMSSSYGKIPPKQPKVGDWVLGRQKLVPNFSTCETTIAGEPIPFPVVETNMYGVSQGTSSQ